MKVIIDYIKANYLAVSVISLAVLILVLSIIIVAAKKKRAKRDAEYAKMFEEVPIENDDREDVDFESCGETKFESCEMDWLKGEKGLSGILRTSAPPQETAKAKAVSKKPANASLEKTDEPDKSPSETDNISQISIDEFAITETDEKQKTEEKNMTAKTDVSEKTTSVTTDKADKAEKKAKTAKTAKPETEKATKKVTGKWLIKEKGKGEFVAYLQANNKEVMLTSETYASVDGAKKGIQTIQKNAADADNFTYYRDKNDNFFFKLKTPQNRFLCAGATYPNKSACLKSIESVRKFIDSPVSDSVEKDITIIEYVPPKDDSTDTKYSGKWIIKSVDDVYMAQLFASNGELMLSTETYASYASAKEAIDNITENGLKGNIIIDSDKKGRYFFKIRNSQKLTLCVGETYAQLSACQSAIESVRKFLKTSKLQDNQ